MKEARTIPDVLKKALVAGIASTIGCGGHPEEGTLKLPPRKEAPEASQPAAKKSGPMSRKAQRIAEEAASGK